MNGPISFYFILEGLLGETAERKSGNKRGSRGPRAAWCGMVDLLD